MIEKYKAFLAARGVSPRTQKNYLSDVRGFIRWVKQNSEEGQEKTGGLLFVTSFRVTTLQAFRKYLVEQKTPPNTTNRRLAGLRRFGEFLVEYGWLKENPAQRVCNTQHLPCRQAGATRNTKDYESILTQFRQALKGQGQKETTIKNYLSDVGQYLEWVTRRKVAQVEKVEKDFLVAGNFRKIA